MAQLMPLPLTVSCFSKIQIGFTFLVPAHLGSPGQRAVKRVSKQFTVKKLSLDYVLYYCTYNNNNNNSCVMVSCTNLVSLLLLLLYLFV